MSTLNDLKKEIDDLLEEDPEHGILECYGIDDQGMSEAISLIGVRTVGVDEHPEGGELLEEGPGFKYLSFALGN